MRTSTGFELRPDLPVLVDRCLFDGSLVRGLRRYGINALTLEDWYPGRSEDVADVEWLADLGDAGGIALTQNFLIWSNKAERETLMEHNTQVFSLAVANWPSGLKSFVFGRWWLPIRRRAYRQQACFWRLYVHEPIRYDLR